MTAGQALNINGGVSGNGSLIADGVGTTVLSAGNTYTGGTVIGSAQGPAVLRANADAALGTGDVVLGTAGNATTARPGPPRRTATATTRPNCCTRTVSASRSFPGPEPR